MTNDDIKRTAFEALIAKTASETGEVKLGRKYDHGSYRSVTVHYTGKIIRIFLLEVFAAGSHLSSE